MGENKLVQVARFYDITEAHIVRGKLETNDIPSYVFDDHHNSIAWNLTIATGGIRVMINESDLDRAKEILADVEEQQEESRKQDSPLFRKPYLKTFFGTILGFMAGAPSIRPTRQKNQK